MLSEPPASIVGPNRPYWTPAGVEGCPYGVVVSAICAGQVPSPVLDSMHVLERDHASALGEDRRREWLGGRLCLSDALARIETVRIPLLPLPSGAPNVPAGSVGSISHKGPLVVAVAARGSGGIGVDIECSECADESLIDRVLTAGERLALDHCDRDSPLTATLYFSAKEAIYKAMPARNQPGIDFAQIELSSPLLASTRGWMTASARVKSMDRAVQVAVFLDSDWIIAAARRT